MPANSSHPIILGRPFLATAGMIINVKEGTLSFSIGNEEIKFDSTNAIKPPRLKDELCRIDTEDENFPGVVMTLKENNWSEKSIKICEETDSGPELGRDTTETLTESMIEDDVSAETQAETGAERRRLGRDMAETEDRPDRVLDISNPDLFKHKVKLKQLLKDLSHEVSNRLVERELSIALLDPAD